MNPELAETIYADFITSSPTTGAAIDADSLPTCEIFEDATDTAILSPTVVKRTSKTGNYRVPIACTTANGFEVGKSYNAVVSATVGAVAAKAIVQTFQVRAVAPVPASQSSVDAISAKLPAALIGGRMDSHLGATGIDAISYTSFATDDVTQALLRGCTTMGTSSATGTTTTLIDEGRYETAIDQIKGMFLLFGFGTSEELWTSCRLITGYDPSTHVITFDPPVPVAVEAGTPYEIHHNSVTAATGGSGDASQATLLAVKAKTDALPSDPADASDVAAQIAVTNGKVDAVAAKTNNLPVDPADASDIAANFATLNTKVDTIDDFLDTEIAAIKAKTDQMVFTGGKIDANATLAIAAGDLTDIADAILKRDWTAVSGEAVYSLLNAARALRNVWSTTGGTYTVKKEDGTTTAWSRTLAVDPAASPIVGQT